MPKRTLKTGPIKDLSERVLARLPKPYTRDVIEDVFCAIEEDTEWYAEYGELAREHTPENTNRRIGQWVRSFLGSPNVLGLSHSKGACLTERYSRMDVGGERS